MERRYLSDAEARSMRRGMVRRPYNRGKRITGVPQLATVLENLLRTQGGSRMDVSRHTILCALALAREVQAAIAADLEPA